MKAVLDTNILIDYLCGLRAAKDEIARYDTPAISLITWIEVLVGAADPREEAALRLFLARFEVLPVSQAVAEAAVEVRREHRLRIPAALIWATALTGGALLVTRNTRDFPARHPGVRVPYSVKQSG